MDNTTNEDNIKWVKIKDFPRYSVSDTGLVRNDKTGKILKPYRIAKKYKGADQVQLQIDNTRKKYLVSHLVALHFLGKPKSDAHKWVLHKDNNRLNNNASNLRWSTRKEIFNSDPDTIEAYRTRINKGNSKVIQKLNPFTGEVISEYPSAKVAANFHNVAPSTITSAVKAKRVSGGFKWKYKD